MKQAFNQVILPPVSHIDFPSHCVINVGSWLESVERRRQGKGREHTLLYILEGSDALFFHYGDLFLSQWASSWHMCV